MASLVGFDLTMLWSLLVIPHDEFICTLQVALLEHTEEDVRKLASDMQCSHLESAVKFKNYLFSFM